MLWGWPRIALWMAARLAPDRAHSIERVATGDLVFASNPSRGKPLDRAIAATGAATIDWMRAHGVAVSSDEVVTHVAIALRNANGDLDFIEAVPPAVRRTSARDFFREWAGGEFWHGTLAEPAVRATGERAAAAALAQLGVPYALDYSQPTAQFYCSSLAEYAYRQAQRARARDPPVHLPGLKREGPPSVSLEPAAARARTLTYTCPRRRRVGARASLTSSASRSYSCPSSSGAITTPRST